MLPLAAGLAFLVGRLGARRHDADQRDVPERRCGQTVRVCSPRDLQDPGQVRVRVDSVGSRVHLNYTSGMRALFGSSTVRITGHALVLTLVDRGSHDRIAIKSSRLKASGRVVRGGFQPSI
jgi:hypothetical protein